MQTVQHHFTRTVIEAEYAAISDYQVRPLAGQSEFLASCAAAQVAGGGEEIQLFDKGAPLEAHDNEDALGVGGDPAKGSEAAEGVRPMYPEDYLELCRLIGQDVIVLENLWTPIKRRQPDGSITTWNNRSFKSREDLNRIVWPDEGDLEARLCYIREYVEGARDTGIGVMFLCGCIFQTLTNLSSG